MVPRFTLAILAGLVNDSNWVTVYSNNHVWHREHICYSIVATALSMQEFILHLSTLFKLQN